MDGGHTCEKATSFHYFETVFGELLFEFFSCGEIPDACRDVAMDFRIAMQNQTPETSP